LKDFRGAVQDKDIRQVETLRKALGETLGSADFAAVKTEADKISRGVYRELNKDIESFIKTAGSRNDVTKWKVANKRISSMIGDLDSSAFKTALNKGEVTPEKVRAMLLNSNKSDSQKLFKSLTPEGKSAARTVIIKDAVDASGGLDAISPQRFVKALEKRGNETGIFFSEAQQKQADGLIRVVKATQRAAEQSVAPPTGAQAMPFVGGAVLADIFGSGGAAIGSALTIGGLSRLYESPVVRDSLVRLSQTKPASEAEGQIIMKLLPMFTSLNQTAKEEK